MCGPSSLFKVLLISTINLADYILSKLECAILLVRMLGIQCYSKRHSKFSAGEGKQLRDGEEVQICCMRV